MNTNHAAAGTYYPAAPGANTIGESQDLYVQGMRVSAQVAGDGSYTAFAGTEIVAEGQLDGSEGVLNTFFAAEALVWSAGVDMDREAQADDELTYFENLITAPVTETVKNNEIMSMVSELGGDYRTLEQYTHNEMIVGTYRMLDIIDNALTHGMTVEVKSNATNDGWYIELSDGGNSGYGVFHFIGRGQR